MILNGKRRELVEALTRDGEKIDEAWKLAALVQLACIGKGLEPTAENMKRVYTSVNGFDPVSIGAAAEFVADMFRDIVGGMTDCECEAELEKRAAEAALKAWEAE